MLLILNNIGTEIQSTYLFYLELKKKCKTFYTSMLYAMTNILTWCKVWITSKIKFNLKCIIDCKYNNWIHFILSTTFVLKKRIVSLSIYFDFIIISWLIIMV